MAARDSKCSAKDAEAGVLAMEALHKQVNFFFFFYIYIYRKNFLLEAIIFSPLTAVFLLQVMPFLLRRTKDEVLSDLPEKIIQDRYCDLSAVQLKLYEKFSGSQAKQEISSMVKVDESADKEEGNNVSAKASTHVFQVK